jgi:predicted metal-dependent hydrolase
MLHVPLGCISNEGVHDMAKKRTKAELKAMAYAIADEVETRAEAIWQRAPKLTYEQCQSLALLQMLK